MSLIKFDQLCNRSSTQESRESLIAGVNSQNDETPLNERRIPSSIYQQQTKLSLWKTEAADAWKSVLAVIHGHKSLGVNYQQTIPQPRYLVGQRLSTCWIRECGSSSLLITQLTCLGRPQHIDCHGLSSVPMQMDKGILAIITIRSHRLWARIKLTPSQNENEKENQSRNRPKAATVHLVHK